MPKKALAVKPLSPLACVGTVKAVTNLRESKSDKLDGFSVFDIVIKPSPQAARTKMDETVYFTFNPKFFAADFVPELDHENGLASRGEEYVYGLHIANEARRNATLERLLGEEGEDQFYSAIDAAAEITPQLVFDLVKELSVGKRVGYVLTQDSELTVVGEKDDGSPEYKRILQDRLSVGELFGPEQVETLEKRAEREEKKEKPNRLKIYWEAGVDPFEED